jgi:O-antigen/teichoic acid export membrane protein
MSTNLLMTRLLVPEVFGVTAIAYLILTGLALFSDLGLSQNVVQSERGNQFVFLNTAWVVQISRGFLLWVLAVGVALLVFVANHLGLVPKDTVYADPSLPYVITALSFAAVIEGFRSTKFYEAARYLAFGRMTLMGVTAQFVGLSCMLAWASVDRSIWVLVAGGLASAVTNTILSHAFLVGNNNRLQWDRSAFVEIFRFGKWIFLSSIVGFLASSGDRLLLGTMVDSAALGVYAIAFLLFSSIEQILNSLIQSIGFPALSEIARRGTSMKAAYYRFHSVIASVAYFSAGFMTIAGRSVVGLLYDRRYAQAGWMLEVLAIGLLAIPSRIGVQSFLALGAPRMVAIVAAIRLVLLLVLVPIGFHYFGLTGAVLGIMISYLSYLPSVFMLSTRYNLLDFRKEVLVLPVILIGMIIGKLFTDLVARFVS